ncbi:T9SS type A sorting domain-containing protein [bacterium]|nr:T9SS type A sorting domain-containing protein [bacterium]
MKRHTEKIIALLCILIYLDLFALERVNLIKSHDFESNVSAWTAETGATDGLISCAKFMLEDTLLVHEGRYSAWFDTRNAPDGVFNDVRDSAIIYQEFVVTKLLADLDSLTVFYFDSCDVDSLKHSTFSVNLLSIPEIGPTLDMRYQLYYAYPFEYPDDLTYLKVIKEKVELNKWKTFSRDVYDDFNGIKGISGTREVNKFVLRNFAMQFENTWWCQKVYLDDIRLTGYADYDVGVKEILSPQGLAPGVPLTPKARIKNFGRKAADTFLVIAEAWKYGDTLYADTLPWSLPADTEDTLEFATWSSPEHCTLTVRTVMTPDESDEDDALSHWIAIIGIEEPSLPQAISLEIEELLRPPSSLIVSYSIPNSGQGTISLFDPAGRRIESYRVQGEGQVAMKSSFSSGVYFIKLAAGKASIIRKVVVLR